MKRKLRRVPGKTGIYREDTHELQFCRRGHVTRSLIGWGFTCTSRSDEMPWIMGYESPVALRRALKAAGMVGAGRRGSTEYWRRRTFEEAWAHWKKGNK